MVWKFFLWFIFFLSATSKSDIKPRRVKVRKNDTKIFEVDCNEYRPFEDDPANINEQSPVNIDVKTTEALDVKPLDYINMKTFDESEVILKNTGTTVRVTFPENTLNLPGITGGPLKDKYTFEQMHFHWGEGDEGSEHEINEERYAMEIHLVYYSTRFKSFEDALESSIGLCVYSILGKISVENNPSLDTFIESLKKLIDPNSEIRAHFNDEFPWIKEDFTQEYYAYHGSLTTEPFKGCVNWIISTKNFNISSKQLAEFRHLHTKENNGEKCINRNFRKLQKLDKRKIFFVKNAEKNGN